MADLSKPPRGTALRERRERRKALVKHEQREMHAALVRDKFRCRNPGCAYRHEKYPIDPAHIFRHRGMGGNPDGQRTERRLIAALCRVCHGLVDAGRLEVTALDSDLLADGPLTWTPK